MTTVKYNYRTPDGKMFNTSSYVKATECGNHIVRTIYEKVSDPEDEKAVDYLVKFWRKNR